MIYFAALTHILCEKYYIDPPEWIFDDMYKIDYTIGDALEQDVHPIMKERNVWVDEQVTERV